MARFTHPNIGDLSDTFAIKQEYTPEGGALLTQPTFDGDPRFYGIYAKIGSVVSFSVNVDMSNILTFGTGQYYLTVPFPAEQDLYFREGHLHDQSSGKEYAVSGHVEAGSTQLRLFTTASNGQDEPFTSTTPFTLAPQDNFHIQGTYIDSTI